MAHEDAGFGRCERNQVIEPSKVYVRGSWAPEKIGQKNLDLRVIGIGGEQTTLERQTRFRARHTFLVLSWGSEYRM